MGAGVVRIKGTDRALAMSVDGNGRYCYLDPYRGAMLAVAEAARNVACAGARPLGATNCLNFGNPERPAIMWQFAKAVEGIGEACRALDVPITGGNVSLYNETDGRAIYPTPVIGVVGLLEHADRVVGRRVPASRATSIVLLGEGRGELGGSEYLKVVHGLVRGVPPALDLDGRARAADAARGAGRRAADAVGARLLGRRPRGDARRVRFDTGGHRRRGVDRGRAGVARRRRSTTRRRSSASRRRASSCRSVPEHVTAVLERAAAAGVPARVIGRTGGSRLRIAVGGDDRDRSGGRRGGARVVDGDRSVLRETGGLNNMFDKFKDECGVFGIFGHPEAANMTYLGLYALQHRGQESAGIAASDGEQVRISRAMGYVADIFDGETLVEAARAARDRPRALLDGRREQAAQRAADPDRLRARPDRALPQRQPRQRARAARRAGAAGVDLPVEQRHRGRSCTSTRGRRRASVEDAIVESVVAGAGRVLARDADEGPADRGPRSARLPAARARPARRCLRRLLGDVRDGSHRRDLRARRRAGRGA